MNFPLSSLIGLLVVMHSAEILSPLPARVHRNVAKYYAHLEQSMPAEIKNKEESLSAELLSSAASPVEISQTTKPLETFERYLAEQKRMKKQKRAMASLPSGKKIK